MYWKDELCFALLQQDQWSVEEIYNLQKRFSRIRVKTLDAKGKVVVFQFSEGGEWFKPVEWAHNHEAALRERLYDSLRRIYDLSSDPGQFIDSVRKEMSKIDGVNDDDLIRDHQLLDNLEDLESGNGQLAYRVDELEEVVANLWTFIKSTYKYYYKFVDEETRFDISHINVGFYFNKDFKLKPAE